MKFIPVAISRKVAEQGLLASENAPKVLFVGGVIGMVGSTVLACRATLKMSEVLEEIEKNQALAHHVKAEVDAGKAKEGTTYTDEEVEADIHHAKIQGMFKVAKLYAPSVILGGLSILMLTKSHNILQDRNVALGAAYAAVDGAYRRYRERVIDRYGEEVDRDLRFDSEQVDVVDEETGEIISTTRATDTPGSVYARYYDADSSRNFSPNPEVNVFFLRTVQTHANDRLRTRGHVFLNEVFSDLGLSHTKAGALVGWRWNRNSGDDYIDFGCWDEEGVSHFYNGRDGAILLDFNVDGPIYNLIEEGT